MRRVTLASLIAIAASPAFAQEAYLDNRSDPEALVQSLYNAINRDEFARAYSYFSEPPAADVETYAEGYADTEHVEVVIGRAAEEGAAGSVYFTLPAAIRATDASGETQVFAGCYTMRLANPAVQGEAFQPMMIEEGNLAPVDAGLDEALPTQCDGIELPAQDAQFEKAKSLFEAEFGEDCALLQTGETTGNTEAEIFEFGFNYVFESETDPEHKVRLFRFFCGAGAYNEQHVHYLANEDGMVTQVQFADPDLDIHYVGDDESQLESVAITGFQARARITNSTFDPETLTMSEHSLWRGLGDAASTSRWIFRNGGFTLVYYEVDASYDGEQTPEVLLDYEAGP